MVACSTSANSARLDSVRWPPGWCSAWPRTPRRRGRRRSTGRAAARRPGQRRACAWTIGRALVGPRVGPQPVHGLVVHALGRVHQCAARLHDLLTAPATTRGVRGQAEHPTRRPAGRCPASPSSRWSSRRPSPKTPGGTGRPCSYARKPTAPTTWRAGSTARSSKPTTPSSASSAFTIGPPCCGDHAERRTSHN